MSSSDQSLCLGNGKIGSIVESRTSRQVIKLFKEYNGQQVPILEVGFCQSGSERGHKQAEQSVMSMSFEIGGIRPRIIYLLIHQALIKCLLWDNLILCVMNINE